MKNVANIKSWTTKTKKGGVWVKYTIALTVITFTVCYILCKMAAVDFERDKDIILYLISTTTLILCVPMGIYMDYASKKEPK